MNPEIARYLEMLKGTEVEIKSVLIDIESVRAALENGDEDSARKAAKEVEQHFSSHYGNLMFNWELFPEKESDDDNEPDWDTRLGPRT